MSARAAGGPVVRRGTLNDKWVLGEILVAGETTTIYAATHRTNGKHVAVRVLDARTTSSAESIERFRREALVANQVGHAGAVQVIDDDVTADGAPFLVLERLDGDSLQNVFRRARTPVAAAEALRVAYELLDVLAAAHQNGIVHANVRPESVFLTRDGKVKLLDFGLASASVAPESADRREADVDARSDVRAVGAILFQLISGKPTPAQPQPGEALPRAAGEPSTPLAAVAPKVSPAVAAVVDRALAIDPAARWPDAGSMQRAIEALAPGIVDRPALRTLDLSPTTPSLKFRVSTFDPPAPGRVALVALGAVTLALGALLGYRLMHRQAAPIAADAAASHRAAPAPTRPPEVELPPATLEPNAVTPEPVVLPPSPHHHHHAPSGPSAAATDPSTPAEAPPGSSNEPSLLDRRH